MFEEGELKEGLTQQLVAENAFHYLDTSLFHGIAVNRMCSSFDSSGCSLGRLITSIPGANDKS